MTYATRSLRVTVLQTQCRAFVVCLLICGLIILSMYKFSLFLLFSYQKQCSFYADYFYSFFYSFCIF